MKMNSKSKQRRINQWMNVESDTRNMYNHDKCVSTVTQLVTSTTCILRCRSETFYCAQTMLIHDDSSRMFGCLVSYPCECDVMLRDEFGEIEDSAHCRHIQIKRGMMLLDINTSEPSSSYSHVGENNEKY